MKLGIISDIHANEAALKTALDLIDKENVDELIVAGDAIYEYKLSENIVRELRRREARFVLGNHEEGFLRSSRALANAENDAVKWLREQPRIVETTVSGRSLLIFHSTPWSPSGEYIMPSHRRFREFGELDHDIVIYGHTHWQVGAVVGKTLVVNGGSVGEPRDYRNEMQGSLAILDTASLEVRHLDFDAQAGTPGLLLFDEE